MEELRTRFCVFWKDPPHPGLPVPDVSAADSIRRPDVRCDTPSNYDVGNRPMNFMDKRMSVRESHNSPQMLILRRLGELYKRYCVRRDHDRDGSLMIGTTTHLIAKILKYFGVGAHLRVRHATFPHERNDMALVFRAPANGDPDMSGLRRRIWSIDTRLGV